MNLGLLLIGAVKLVVGVVLGAVCIVLSYRLVSRALRGGQPLAENPAAGVLHGSALVALALLARNSLSAAYDTIDLFVHAGAADVVSVLKVAAHGILHVGLALVLGTGLLAMAVWLFNRLTPEIDELGAVGHGRVGPALVLGAIIVSLALLTAPGLEALLAALVPFPQLPASTTVAPP